MTKVLVTKVQELNITCNTITQITKVQELYINTTTHEGSRIYASNNMG